MDVGRVVFSFCCLGALFGSSFSFCTSRCTVRRDKFSPVCLAHPLRCCKKKKKNDKHDRQRTAKNQTTVTTAVTPALTTVRRDKFSPVCLAHPLRCCKKKKKRQARQAAHHKKSNDRYHSCNPRDHEGLAALCPVVGTVHLPHKAWYAPA